MENGRIFQITRRKEEFAWLVPVCGYIREVTISNSRKAFRLRLEEAGEKKVAVISINQVMQEGSRKGLWTMDEYTAEDLTMDNSPLLNRYFRSDGKGGITITP